MKIKKHIIRKLALTVLAGCIPAAAGLMSATAAPAPVEDKILQPASLPYGLSYEEWSAKWWQWYMGLETNHIEFVGAPDICSGPASHVRFLYGAPGTTTATRHVTLGPDVSLSFPVLGYIADNTACPVSDFTTNTGAELTAEVIGGWNGVTLTTCTLDGVAVEGLDDPQTSIYDVVAPAFSYTVAEKNSIISLVEGEDCIPGDMTIYPAVADGVYLMLAPLKPGKHTIHFIASAPGLDVNVTYDITVEND
jgi:hypothetical protein